MNISIIGTGSWGLAIAESLAKNGHNIKMWSYSEEEKNNLNENKKSIYFKDHIFNDNIIVSSDFKEVIGFSNLIFHVTPSAFFRKVLNEYKNFLTPEKYVIICSKGFEKETLKTLEDVFYEETESENYGVFTGPSHAEEVINDEKTTIVIASKNEDILNIVTKVFNPLNIRIYKSNDIIGAAFGGATKNIIALCAGILSGMGFGDNAFASLITRGLAEMARLAEKVGAKKETIYGLTGLGDLIVTCMSNHSRNRRAGILLAKGYTKEQIEKEVGMVIESFQNTEIVHELGKKYGIEMPITDAVNMILKGEITIEKAVENLMLRENKFE